jgi:hypothetical protein
MMTNDYSPVFLGIIEELFGMTIEVGMAAESKDPAEIAERRAELLSSRVAKANFWKGLHDIGLGFHGFNPYCDECNQIFAGQVEANQIAASLVEHSEGDTTSEADDLQARLEVLRSRYSEDHQHS